MNKISTSEITTENTSEITSKKLDYKQRLEKL
jgi:hypothetical protein